MISSDEIEQLLKFYKYVRKKEGFRVLDHHDRRGHVTYNTGLSAIEVIDRYYNEISETLVKFETEQWLVDFHVQSISVPSSSDFYRWIIIRDEISKIEFLGDRDAFLDDLVLMKFMI